jgi:replicative DNA helicase
MTEVRFRCAADLLDDWRDSILSGTPPTLYPVGTGELARIEVGPGSVVLIGGPPNAGKSALSMQLVCDALMLTPDLKAIVCNVEMSPTSLLDRQLARLADIDLTLIRHRRLAAGHAERAERGLQDLEHLADRLAFVRAPFNLAAIAAGADDFQANLIVLDYIQRIGPPPGSHEDRRGGIDATMSYLRQFADAGVAVLAVAAVSRSKDARGRSSYNGEGLNLASFRETSELEYGADDAFILAPADDGEEQDGPTRRVVLRHLKSRHGETRDIPLVFDGAHQRFTPIDPDPPRGRADGGKLTAALRALWDRAEPARDDDDRGEA